ncbi:hypothetical protein TCAL_08389, partial [Tigriopus californicus]
FPLGKVPTFEDDSGVCLFESNAIAYHVANEALRGSDPVQKALVQQWISFAESEVLPAACTWVFQVLGLMQTNKNAQEKAKDELKVALKMLDNTLLHATFLVGERLTLADITVMCNLLLAFRFVFDPQYRQTIPNIVRWFNTIINQPNVKAVIGSVKLCEKVGASAAPAAKKDNKKKEDKKPAPAPAAAAAPAPAGDGLSMPSEKTKDPLSALPKGNFDMDDFKRFYSNNDEDKSVPYFWEKFDPEHYSIWRCDYKYNDELAMVFMSCNLIGGMFQRLEKLRKNAFASVCLFGENNKSAISGIWVWRGHDLCFDLSEDWQIDYNSYDWKKLDAKDAETKKLVDQYFKWEGEDKNGLKFNQGKIFK